MNILILANHYPVASGRYVAEALRRLGHTVYTDGPAMGRNVWGMTVPADQVWTPNPLPTEAMPSLNVVIVMDSDPALLDRSIAYSAFPSVPVVVWGVDNHVRDYRRDWFAHYFVAHKEVSLMPWRADMTWTPCAYDPTVFAPGKAWDERTIDVALIGVLYPQRRQAVRELRAAGFNVVAGMGLFGESMASVYQNAKVSLSLSVNHDLSQRIFETAACGCAVLTDPLPDLAWAMIPGIAMWDGHDLPGTVETIIHGDPMVTMQQIGFAQETLPAHTWDVRAVQVLSRLEALGLVKG